MAYKILPSGQLMMKAVCPSQTFLTSSFRHSPPSLFFAYLLRKRFVKGYDRNLVGWSSLQLKLVLGRVIFSSATDEVSRISDWPSFFWKTGSETLFSLFSTQYSLFFSVIFFDFWWGIAWSSWRGRLDTFIRICYLCWSRHRSSLMPRSNDLSARRLCMLFSPTPFCH